jgi:hypothetical protein
MNPDLEHLLANFEQTIQATLEMPDDEAHDALVDLISRLKEIPEAERDARASYALGYAWYNMPGESERRSTEIEHWLGRALELEPGNQNARLYLGHHLFSIQRYAEARRLLTAIPAGALESLGQRWWALKVQELIACCEIYLDPNFFDTRLVKNVCRGYAEAAPGTAVPTELVEALMWALGKTMEPTTKNFIADATIFLMDKMGLRDQLARGLQCQDEGEPE